MGQPKKIRNWPHKGCEIGRTRSAKSRHYGMCITMAQWCLERHLQITVSKRPAFECCNMKFDKDCKKLGRTWIICDIPFSPIPATCLSCFVRRTFIILGCKWCNRLYGGLIDTTIIRWCIAQHNAFQTAHPLLVGRLRRMNCHNLNHAFGPTTRNILQCAKYIFDFFLPHVA